MFFKHIYINFRLQGANVKAYIAGKIEGFYVTLIQIAFCVCYNYTTY